MACTKKNVRCTSTRKETERKTENQVERLMNVRDMESGRLKNTLDWTKWKIDIQYHYGDPR